MSLVTQILLVAALVVGATARQKDLWDLEDAVNALAICNLRLYDKCVKFEKSLIEEEDAEKILKGNKDPTGELEKELEEKQVNRTQAFLDLENMTGNLHKVKLFKEPDKSARSKYKMCKGAVQIILGVATVSPMMIYSGLDNALDFEKAMESGWKMFKRRNISQCAKDAIELYKQIKYNIRRAQSIYHTVLVAEEFYRDGQCARFTAIKNQLRMHLGIQYQREESLEERFAKHEGWIASQVLKICDAIGRPDLFSKPPSLISSEPVGNKYVPPVVIAEKQVIGQDSLQPPQGSGSSFQPPPAKHRVSPPKDAIQSDNGIELDSLGRD